jgi:hypothetical protein
MLAGHSTRRLVVFAVNRLQIAVLCPVIIAAASAVGRPSHSARTAGDLRQAASARIRGNPRITRSSIRQASGGPIDAVDRRERTVVWGTE